MRMLFDLVPDAARAFPDRLAVRDPEQSLSYAELADKTARLATCLNGFGVGCGDRVAIMMPSSAMTAVAVHGIFRAGAAFVPVDPEAPPARVRAILNDCDVTCILAAPSVRNKLLEAVGDREATIIGTGDSEPVEVGWEEVFATEPHAPDPPRDPESLAYIMYTSGSTGAPKGIAHSHRSGLAYAERAVATYDIVPQDIVAVTGPLHFDISTLAYLATPLAAAGAAIVPAPFARMPASLSAWLETAGVTIFYTVSSALIQLVDRGALHARELSQLRWILFCGEPLPPAHFARALKAFPNTWFSNSYGPAEVNQCTFRHFPPDTDTTVFNGQLPIGQCWSETSAILLDDGAISDGEGELAVHSPTMMIGYWNRPDLESCVYHDAPDGRAYYRTGDLASIVDGEYVLLGRVDRQVKVRGYRVELDEIERHLADHPDVAEAAAYPIIRGETVTGIGAAVIAEQPLPEAELRRFLDCKLPRYAIPERLCVVTALPRTTSGKIDRRALAEEARLAEETGS